MLELLGRSRGSTRGSGGGGELTGEEASTVCICAVSLIGPTGGAALGEAGGDPAGKGDAAAPGLFPLDIDQEVTQKYIAEISFPHPRETMLSTPAESEHNMIEQN